MLSVTHNIMTLELLYMKGWGLVDIELTIIWDTDINVQPVRARVDSSLEDARVLQAVRPGIVAASDMGSTDQ